MSTPGDMPQNPGQAQWQQPPASGGYPQPPAPGYPHADQVHGSGAQSQLSPSDERMWSLLAHLGTWVLGFIAPLIVMLVQGEKSPFVRRHAVESLNFQVTLFIAYLVSSVLVLVLVGLLLLPIVIIGHLVFTILAAVAANRGADYRYPLTLRLVK